MEQEQSWQMKRKAYLELVEEFEVVGKVAVPVVVMGQLSELLHMDSVDKDWVASAEAVDSGMKLEKLMVPIEKVVGRNWMKVEAVTREDFERLLVQLASPPPSDHLCGHPSMSSTLE